MAEEKRKTDRNIKKAVTWQKRLERANTLKDIQLLRNRIVKEVKGDQPLEEPVEKAIKYIIETELIYLFSYVSKECYENMGDNLIRLTKTMQPDSKTEAATIWDYILDEVLDFYEMYYEKTGRKKSLKKHPKDFEGCAKKTDNSAKTDDITEKSEEQTEKTDNTTEKTDNDRDDVLIRLLILNIRLKRTYDEDICKAIELITKSLEKFAVEEGLVETETKNDPDKEKADDAEQEEYEKEIERISEKFSSPLEIKAELDKYIVGQEHAKRNISMVLYHHLRSMAENDKVTSQSILLLGNTGSGKTMIAKKIAAISGLPCTLVDASRLTENGWKGGDIEDVFARMYKKGKIAKFGVAVFDEFDKLVKMGMNSAGEDVGKERQSIFLDPMEGVTIVDTNRKDRLREYDTKHMLFIFTGAFNSIQEIRKKNSCGFGFRDDLNEKDRSYEGKDAELRKELIEVGVLPEIVGRLTCIEELSVMDENEMYKAVTDSPDSELYKAKEYIPSVYGKEIITNEGYIKSIISKMRKASLGVRGCNNYFRERIMELLFTSYEKEENEINLTYEREER